MADTTSDSPSFHTESSHAQATQVTPENKEAAAENDDDWLVACRCESAKSLATLLSCLEHIHNDSEKKSSRIQLVTAYCTHANISFHVTGKAKQIQASVDMPSTLFSEYRVAQYDDQDGGAGEVRVKLTTGNVSILLMLNLGVRVQQFSVNLTTLLEYLHLLGTPTLDRTKCFFSYNTAEELFRIELLEESGVLSTTAIPGMLPASSDPAPSLAQAFRSADTCARMIVQSDTLLLGVQELEHMAGAKSITVSLKTQTGLEMVAVGDWGECHVQVPGRGNHVVSMEVSNTTANDNDRSYSMKSFMASMKGLEIAQETCITMNEQGMLAIQHQVVDSRHGGDKPNFVDFIMCCLEDDGEEREIEDNDADQHDERVPATGKADKSENSDSDEDERWRLPSNNQLSRSRKLNRQTTLPNSSDDDEASGDDDDIRIASERSFAETRGESMFNSSTLDTSMSSRSPAAATSRGVRRRYGRRNVNKESSSESEGSRNLLESDDDDEEEETELQHLDVTAAPMSQRDGNSSSPELVYGRQN